MGMLFNIGLLATGTSKGAQGELLLIPNAALAWREGRITWVGPEREMPKEHQSGECFDAKGRLVIPGLIDCHTHLAFAGWRAEEFEQKLLGASYAEIAKKGGGIVSTVEKTRAATKDELVERSLGFISKMARLGVTTVEAKSGYGLSTESEIKLLEVYREISNRSLVSVVPTFLGAHTIPLEYKEHRSDYVQLVINEMLPAVQQKSLAQFCDVFVEEGIAFSPDEARLILTAARKLGMEPKLHVDQLSDGGGAKLAAELKAVSADHLEHANAEGLRAMAEQGVVGVVLPFACLYAKQPPLKVREFLTFGGKVAVATDFNPGSAPSYHLPLALSLSCTMSGLTPHEALGAATTVAAKALDLHADRGALEVGKVADMAVLEASSVNEWLYHMVPNACVATFKGGRLIAGEVHG